MFSLQTPLSESLVRPGHGSVEWRVLDPGKDIQLISLGAGCIETEQEKEVAKNNNNKNGTGEVDLGTTETSVTVKVKEVKVQGKPNSVNAEAIRVSQ